MVQMWLWWWFGDINACPIVLAFFISAGKGGYTDMYDGNTFMFWNDHHGHIWTILESWTIISLIWWYSTNLALLGSDCAVWNVYLSISFVSKKKCISLLDFRSVCSLKSRTVLKKWMEKWHMNTAILMKYIVLLFLQCFYLIIYSIVALPWP